MFRLQNNTAPPAVTAGAVPSEVAPDQRAGPYRRFARRALVLNFTVVYRVDRWMRRRFSPMGRMVLGMLVLGTIFGINTRVAVAYQLAALALVVLFLAALWAPVFRPKLTVSRRLPAYAQVGEACTCSVLVDNRGQRPLRGILLLDELSPSSEVWRVGRDGVSADARRRNWFDRKVGYPRWAALLRRAEGTRIAAVEVPTVDAGERLEVRVSLTPVRRGFLRFTCSRILKPDPLGVFYGQRAITNPGKLLVLPRRHPVDWPEVSRGRAREHMGLVDANSHGGVEEFTSIREYRPGDALRHIHWRGWARYGYPVVKEFHDQRLCRPAVILDTALSASTPLELFEAAVEVAASLTAAAGRGQCALVLGGLAGQWLSAGRGEEVEAAQLEALACVLPCEGGLGGLRRVISAHRQELEEAVFVCTGWNEVQQAFVEDLEAEGVPVRVALVHESGRGPGQWIKVPPPAETLFLDAGNLTASLAAVRAASPR